jgi:lipopolysaccharide heptosyltransferase I
VKRLRAAIVRLTSLGDVVHTLPVAGALRRHDPSMHLVWIVEERERALVLDNPAVDEVVVAPVRRWRAELKVPGRVAGVLREWGRLRRRLRGLELDVAIDVQGLLKSAHFSILTGAPLRIGFAWSHVRDPLAPFLATHRVSPPADAVHVVDQNLSLLGPLGIPREPAAFPLPRAPGADARAQAFLARHGVGRDERLVALLPATRGPAKQWPVAQFRALAARLVRAAGARLLVLGGPGEERLLEEVGRGLGEAAVLSGDASLLDLAALLRRAQLAVGNDCGPLHLAAALGTPTLGLYGPTRPERNGPYGPRARALRSATRRMADLGVDSVFARAMECLEEAPGDGDGTIGHRHHA